MVGAIAACAAWLAAPALSGRPYVPDPVDFELRDSSPALVRTVARDSAGRSSSTNGRANGSLTVVHSRIIRTPKRFNLVGLRWRGARRANVLLRVRRGDGQWSRWARLRVDGDHAPDAASEEGRRSWTVSDPVWAGAADELQYRIAAAGPVRRATLHFVNSTGTATAFDRFRSGVRRVAAGAVHAAASLLGVSAKAATAQPEIVTRDQWGAAKCPPRDAPDYGEVKLAFVHHTVTTNEYSPEQSPAMVLGICRYHRNSNGWDDIGYQFIVDRYGKIFEGRAGGIDQAVVGAQAQGYNSQSTGISSLGTFSTTGQTEEGLAALARLLSWKLAVHGVPPRGTVTVRSGGGPLNRYPAGRAVTFQAISGHRDGDATACPGDGLYSQLPRLRDMVTGDARAATALSLGASRGTIVYGRKARLAGSLKGADGSPLEGQVVQVRAFKGGANRTLAKLTTGSNGSFNGNLRLAFNRVLQASFGGNPAMRAAQSRLLKIAVRSRVDADLDRSGSGAIRPGERISLRGRIRPRKRRALLLIDRRGSDGAYRRVEKRELRPRGGRVRASHSFRRGGEYRIKIGVPPDRRNLGARSEPVQVTVR